MNLDLRKFFTREAIVRSLQSLPQLATAVMDVLYPPGVRINYPFPVIGYQDLGLPAGNIPVVRRGSASYGLKPSDGSIAIIEPQPVNPSVFLDAALLNNMAMLNPEGQQQVIDNKIDTLRQACRQTAEALSAQSVTGKISYPMATEGAGFLDYEVDWGTPAAVVTDTKWDAGGAKLSAVIKGCGKVIDALRKKGYGSNVEFWIGFDAFAALLDLVAAVANAPATVTPGLIVLGGGLKFRLQPASYVDLATGASVSAVPEKKMVAIDLAGGHKLFYAALDDLDANLQAMPFFAKPVKLDDPSGYKIVGASKPLPVPNVKAIVTTQVLT